MRIFLMVAGLSAFLISPVFVSSVAAYNGVCPEGSCKYTEYCRRRAHASINMK